MSNVFTTSSVKLGLVLGLVAASFAGSAEQITFNELVTYHVAERMQELKFEQRADLEQSTYNLAFGHLNADAGLPGRRPVITVSKISQSEEE